MVEPWSPAAALRRLVEVAPKVPVVVPNDPQLLQGQSNDAWRLGDAVLRVCWRGDRERLLREAKLGEALPDTVRYPRVRCYGRDDSSSWILTDHVAGTSAAEAWPAMTAAQRQAIVTQLAGLLAALHSWDPPVPISTMISDAEPGDDPDPMGVVGDAMVPLPADRLQLLIAPAKELPFADVRVLDDVGDLLADLASSVRHDRRDDLIIHGDASPGNLLVEDHEITAMVDYEWARIGPRDLELLPWLVWTERNTPGGQEQTLGWLGNAYPELFAAPELNSRLLLYQVSYNLRGMFVWPADQPEHKLPTAHPIRRLRHLAETHRPTV